MAPSDPQQLPPNQYGDPNSYGGYGYGGAYGYGYGYDYGYGKSPSQTRNTINEIILILRERIWYIVSIFLIILSLTLVYTFSRPKIYQASCSLQMLRREARITSGQTAAATDIVNTEDFNTIVEVLKSGTLIQRVTSRLTGEELRLFMAPYERGKDEDPITPGQILGENREILPLRATLVIRILYSHPDRFIATKVANLFAEEFIALGKKSRLTEVSGVTEVLETRVQQQERKVRELGSELQRYREEHKQVSLEATRDITTEKLKQVNAVLTQATVRLNDAEARWKQVEQRLNDPLRLTELSFISGQSVIDLLTKDVASKKIQVAQLAERYKDKHPAMIEARGSLAQSERELIKALNSAAIIIQSEYQLALKSFEQAKRSLDQAQQEAMKLGRLEIDYKNKERELEVQTAILQNLVAKYTESSIDSTVESQKARLLDMAAPPGEDDYVSPKVLLNVVVGSVGGLILGLGIAFFIAYIDDRVKSSFDIETVVGLPLIGVIPKLKNMSQSEKAQIAASHLDSSVTEAFLSLHSNIKLNALGKNAKCILVTSSIPGEGKSFVTTNTAITMAAHGEKVAIVDCDLRKPNIHRSFQLDNLKGIIDVCAGTATLDEVAVTGLHENLTVYTTGGRAKNPTQVLNSKEFESMIVELRKRYDRIFFDTPPITAVSDALRIMPLADAALFTVFFNKVRRKVAQFSAHRLLDLKLPVLGAVLNGLAISTSGYYYAQYAQKATYGYGYQMPQAKQPQNGQTNDEAPPEKE